MMTRVNQLRRKRRLMFELMEKGLCCLCKKPVGKARLGMRCCAKCSDKQKKYRRNHRKNRKKLYKVVKKK